MIIHHNYYPLLSSVNIHYNPLLTIVSVYLYIRYYIRYYIIMIPIKYTLW